MRPKIGINIGDAHIGIWQDNAHDPTFREEIFGPLIRRMRDRGWAIGRNKEIHQRYRILSPNNRAGAKGSLRCEIEAAGRCIKIDFCSMTAPQINRNGRKYDFDKMARMSAMDRRRVELEYRRVIAWLETLAPISVERRDMRGLTGMQKIAKSYAESWHSDKELGRPVCKSEHYRQTRDGAALEHGQTVYIEDRNGRILRGTAYYNINNMWWVVAGGVLRNVACFHIWANSPGDLRVKRNEKQRRKRLERELSEAINRMDFLRANTLKQILFGVEQVYWIWHREHGAYYGPQYAGYYTDRNAAGKYTRAEAEKECKLAPDILEMVCPDGQHVRFERKAA